MEKVKKREGDIERKTQEESVGERETETERKEGAVR